MRTLLRKYRWRWINHILRKRTDDITRVALRWTPKGKEERQTQKPAWRRTVEKELQDINLIWGEVEKIAKSREDWEFLILTLCVTGHSKD
jgi:hypothetical protein